MDTATLLLMLSGLLVLGGAGVGVALVVRTRPAVGLEADPFVPRVTADVHAGEEQILIHLARSLQVAAGRADVAYGEVYIVGSAGNTMRLASRSEIGRGFDGEVRVQRGARSSTVEYFVLRVPGDDSVHDRIAQLDDQIAQALRSLDPAARVQIGQVRARVSAGTPATS